MCFIFSLIPATFWAVVGYFVLYTADKAEGGMRKYGRFLAVWIFVIASLIPIMGVYMSIKGICPLDIFFGM